LVRAPVNAPFSWPKNSLSMRFLGLLEGDVDLVGRERLDQVVEGAIAHARHGRFDRGVAGHHHDQGLHRPVLEDAEDVGALPVGQTDIDEHEVPVVLAEVILGDGQGGHPDDLELTALELHLQSPPDDLVVFDDQDLFERHVLVAFGHNLLSRALGARFGFNPARRSTGPPGPSHRGRRYPAHR
jgi:hypothetical protein